MEGTILGVSAESGLCVDMDSISVSMEGMDEQLWATSIPFSQ